MTDDYYSYQIPKWKVVSAVVAVAVVLFGIATVFAHPFRKTNADVVALSYGGGPFEGKQYQDTIGPGSGLVNNGLFDQWYEYPNTVRDFVASVDGEGEENVRNIPCTDNDGVRQQVELTAYFRLNTNNDVIQTFHEDLGLKYHAWNGGSYKDGDGWDALLAHTIRGPLESSVGIACRDYSTDQFQKGESILPKLATSIASGLKSTINEAQGHDYFCGPGFVRGREGCPEFEVVVKRVTPKSDAISKSYDEIKASANGIETAKNKAQQDVERARGSKASSTEAAEVTETYIRLREVEAQLACAKSKHCTLVVTPSSGTDVNVNAGGR